MTQEPITYVVCFGRRLTDKQCGIIADALWNHKYDVSRQYTCKVCELVEVSEEYEEYKDELYRLVDLFDSHKNIDECFGAGHGVKNTTHT